MHPYITIVSEPYEVTIYEYQVTFITEYSTITTKVSIELDEVTGNLSDTARDRAIDEAKKCLFAELGLDLNNFCDVNVELDTMEGYVQL